MNEHSEVKLVFRVIVVVLFGFRLLSAWGYEQTSVQQQRKEIESEVQRLLVNDVYAKKYAKFNSKAVREFWVGSLLCAYNDLDSANSLREPAAQRGAFEEGITHLEKAISIDPQLSDAYLVLGRALGTKSFLFVDDRYGKEADVLRKEEVQMYRKAVEVDPTNVEAHFAYGTSLRDPRERLKELQTVLSLDPNHREAHDQLGNAYSALGDQKRAIEEYKKQIDICPHCDDTYPKLVRLLAETKRMEALRETCATYAKNEPGGIMRLISGPAGWYLQGGLLQLEKEYALKGMSDIIETMATESLVSGSAGDDTVAAFRLLLNREPSRKGPVIKILESHENEHKTGQKAPYKETQLTDPVSAFLAELKGR